MTPLWPRPHYPSSVVGNSWRGYWLPAELERARTEMDNEAIIGPRAARWLANQDERGPMWPLRDGRDVQGTLELAL